MFKTFNLLKNPLSYFHYQKVGDDEFQRFTNLEIQSILAETKNFEILLKLTDVSLVKRKYHEGTEKVLEDAKRKQV